MRCMRQTLFMKCMRPETVNDMYEAYTVFIKCMRPKTVDGMYEAYTVYEMYEAINS